MKRGFVTIEAIIAFVVLTFAILMTVSSVRTLNLYKSKKDFYQDLYMSVLSVKDLIKNKDLEKNRIFEGELNGFKYRAQVKKEDVKHNMLMDEFFGFSPGTYQVTLYKILLEMKKGNLVKNFSFLLTREKLLKEYQYRP
ncbi:MAG: hypothetical protein GXO31_07780 [Epsilonproteobacteria bacterium]|nr:hypothetical protein [Campylobacterota bacterium]